MSQTVLFKRIMPVAGLALLLAMNTVIAQGGPPPEVRRAVDALVDVVNSTDETALSVFIDKAADPAVVKAAGRDELISTLRAIRTATQGLSGDINVQPAPDGVQVTLGGAGANRTIAMSLSPGGVTSLTLLPDSAPVAVAPTTLNLVPGTESASEVETPSSSTAATQAHIAALERSGHKNLDEVTREFETARFSATYMANTTVTERRAILERIRSVVSNADGIMLNENDGEVTLTLRGPQNLNVVFTVESQAPFGINTLRTEAASADPGMELTWKGARKTFRDLEKKGFSGVVHLARGDQTVLHKAYGKSNRELGYNMQIDTIFGIGSTPIDFTVSGIYLLAQAGKLNLDDTLGKFFTDVPADKTATTIAHLISGQSGLPDFHGNPRKDWDLDLAWIDRDTAVARILAQPLLFAPGSSQAHSHSAYGLAAAIIELISGQAYFDFMQENIFGPAGMTRTGMYGDARGFTVGDFAVGYAKSSVGVPNIPPNWGPTSWLVMGSGGMYSTLDDMLKFYAYMRSGKVLDAPYAARYRGETLGTGGSERGFFILHASRGTEKEIMMLINSEGRTPEMRALTGAMEGLLEND